MKFLKGNILFFILFILLSLAWNSGFTTEKGNSESLYETVFVQINRSIFISGSELKYSAWVTNETDKQTSNIIYFEIIDCNGWPVSKWKSKTQQHKCSGEKTIPESINNGLYFFRAYTNAMREYPNEAVFTTPILIQRIYEDPADSVCLTDTYKLTDTIQIKNQGSNHKFLNIEVSQTNDLTLNLVAGDELKNSDLTVAITELPDILFLNTPINFEAKAKNSREFLFKKKPELLPHENGYYLLSGRLLYLPDSVPVAQKYIYLASPDSTIHFSYFKTTKNGEFCFLIDSAYDNKILYLQLDDLECPKDSLFWDVDSKEPNKPFKYHYYHRKTSDSERDYIDELQKREIINQVYKSSKSEVKHTPIEIIQPNFFYKPAYVVKPSDYVDLNDFRDICDNILPSVRFKVENNKVEIGMVINQQVIYDNILLCVNGIPCLNMNFIENLNSKDIKQIEIFNQVLMYGDLTFNGVIGIYTNKDGLDERLFCNPYYAFTNSYYSDGNSATFQSPTTSSPNVNPDYYWNPSVNLKGKESQCIRIPKPEIGTSYIISVNGLVNQLYPFGYQKIIKLK